MSQFPHKRRSIRFLSDPGTLVLLEPLFGNAPTHLGLVVDESHTGCSGVFRSAPQLVNGARFRVTVGELPPVDGSIVWVRQLEANIVRIGFALDVELPGAAKT